MADFPHFAGEPIWLVTVAGSRADATIPVSVNGHTIKVPRATPTRMPEPFKVALETGGYSLTALPEITDELAIDPLGEEDQSAGAGDPGETGSQIPGTTFDAEAIITGTVAQVTSRLDGLTPEQLAAVKAAESDREKARVGVLEAIAKLTAEPPAE